MHRDPFEMLTRCHRRLEEELQTLVIEPAPDVAARVLEFIDRALKRHEDDEEHSLFPRLPSELGGLVEELRAQHRQQAAMVEELRRAVDEKAIEVAAMALQATYARHISVEEKQLFPAAEKALDAAARDALGEEMQARRGR
jgi:hemerythrin-like domain-containing protein